MADVLLQRELRRLRRLSSFLPIYYHDQYGLSGITTGYFTAACVFVGSFARPFGGSWPTASAAPAHVVIYALVAALLLIVFARRAAGRSRPRHADGGVWVEEGEVVVALCAWTGE